MEIKLNQQNMRNLTFQWCNAIRNTFKKVKLIITKYNTQAL